MRVIIKCDGGCASGGAVAAGAAIAYDESGRELGRGAKFLTGVTTPVAEYMGLLTGLQLAIEHGATSVVAWMDAELVVRQVDGRYRCRNERLRPMLGLVKSYMARFDHAEVKELPKAGNHNKRRHTNADADALATECMSARKDL